jgi:hypothetical protein
MNATPDIIDEMMFNEEISRSRFAITPQRLSALKDFSTLPICTHELGSDSFH